MKNDVRLLILLLLAFKGYAQIERVAIVGKVTHDKRAVENIHIVNKNSKKVTSTDLNGIFEMPVKEGDTLFLSSVQFENKTSIVSKIHIESKRIHIRLRTAVNTLNEIRIEAPENMAGSLGLPNANKKPLNKLERRLNYHTSAPLPIAIIATLLGQRGGIEDMFYIISGKRKKDRKLKELIARDEFMSYQSQQILVMRKDFKDTFFMETLKIPNDKIDYFIKFCDEKAQVIALFRKNRKLEAIDIFLKEHKAFLEKIENEE